MPKLIIQYEWTTRRYDFSFMAPAQRLGWLEEIVDSILRQWDEGETWTIPVGDPLMLARVQRYVGEGKIPYEDIEIQMPVDLSETKYEYYLVDEYGEIMGPNIYKRMENAEHNARHDAVKERERRELKTDPKKKLTFAVDPERAHIVSVYRGGVRVGEMHTEPNCTSAQLDRLNAGGPIETDVDYGYYDEYVYPYAADLQCIVHADDMSKNRWLLNLIKDWLS